jgi:hypothetical protein
MQTEFHVWLTGQWLFIFQLCIFQWESRNQWLAWLLLILKLLLGWTPDIGLPGGLYHF